jgi:hypothetical protein
MHAFALLMGTMLNHIWARSITTDAQKIVVYFKASHKPHALLKAAAKEADIKIGLRTSNKTRFTSMHMMLTSVKANERSLKSVLRTNSSDITSPVVKAIINDPAFWQDLEQLVQLLDPLSKVIMAIQGNHSTLGDVTRYFLYLACKLKEMLPLLENKGASD